MSLCCTYVHVSACGTPYYVGAGTLARARNFYRGRENYLGPEEFTFDGRKPYVIIYESEDRGKAFEFEKELIQYYGRMDKDLGTLYNRTDGPGIKEGHREPPSAEARAAVSESNRRRVYTEATREKYRRSCAGRKLTKEQCSEISKRLIGHTFTQETRDKIAATLRGRPSPLRGQSLKEETVEKMRQARLRIAAKKREEGTTPPSWIKGLKHKQETRDKMKIAQRARRMREKQDENQ